MNQDTVAVEPSKELIAESPEKTPTIEELARDLRSLTIRVAQMRTVRTDVESLKRRVATLEAAAPWDGSETE